MSTKDKIKEISTLKLRVYGFFCFLFLAISVVWIIIFYFHIQGEEKLSQSNFPYLNPARKVYENKNMIVDFQELRDQLNEYSNNPNMSIYFEYLNTGSNISVNKESEFWPASLLKVPLAIAVARKVDRREWKWDDKLLILEQDKNDRYGDLHNIPSGTSVTLDSLVYKMLTNSDNTAYYSILRNISIDELDSIYAHLGYDNLLDKEGKIGAKKYSILFRSLYNSTYLKEESSQKLLAYLVETPFKNFASSGIGDDVPFAHKFGISDDKSVNLDSGIVFVPGKPYILTILVSEKDVKKAESIMKDISKKVFEYVRDTDNVDIY